jgi:hypothetical protein
VPPVLTLGSQVVFEGHISRSGVGYHYIFVQDKYICKVNDLKVNSRAFYILNLLAKFMTKLNIPLYVLYILGTLCNSYIA